MRIFDISEPEPLRLNGSDLNLLRLYITLRYEPLCCDWLALCGLGWTTEKLTLTNVKLTQASKAENHQFLSKRTDIHLTSRSEYSTSVFIVQ